GLVRLGCELMGLVWVHANSEPDIGPEVLNSVRLGGFLLVCGSQNDKRPFDTRLSGASDDRLEIAGKDFVGEMTMRINHCARPPNARATRVGTSSHPRSWYWRLFERHDDGLAAVRARGEDHAVRLNPHQLRRLQV